MWFVIYGIGGMSKSREQSESISERSDETQRQQIELRNLRKTFNKGSVVAVDDVSVTIGHDELLVLLGPSGCGKTTTLRCIAGLELPDSGEILIGGEDVSQKKPKDRNIAFVFQSVTLFPHMSVRKNMRFGLDMKTDLSNDEKDERVEEAATVLGIEELLNRKPTELSGGQRQRVSLGRAMVMEPSAFLLDEPFSALDANLRDQMQTEIQRLNRRLETAMVFVTHDQEEAMTIGDKIVIMDEGRIRQVGTPHEIFNDPQDQFVAGFIGSPSTNMFDCQVIERDGEVVLSNAIFELPLPPDIDRVQLQDGQSVTLGIRPEYVQIEPSTPLFTGEVTVTEPQSDRDVLYISVEDTELRAVAPQGIVDEKSESVGVQLDTDRMWIFDEKGSRLV